VSRQNADVRPCITSGADPSLPEMRYPPEELPHRLPLFSSFFLSLPAAVAVALATLQAISFVSTIAKTVISFGVCAMRNSPW
jgi:hypothetical protein